MLVQNHPSNGWHWEHPVLRSPGFIRKHHARCSAVGRRGPLCGVCCQSPLCPAAGCATFLRPQRRGPISGASPSSSCLFGQKSLSILVVSNCCFHLRNAARGLEFGDLSAFSAWSLPGHETGGVQLIQPKGPIPPMAHLCPARSSHRGAAPSDPSSATSSTGNGWEHPASLPSPALVGLSPSPHHLSSSGARAQAQGREQRGGEGSGDAWGHEVQGGQLLWPGIGGGKHQLAAGVLLPALLHAFLRQLSPQCLHFLSKIDLLQVNRRFKAQVKQNRWIWHSPRCS